MIADIICSKRILKKYGLGAFCKSVLGFSRRHMSADKVRRPSVQTPCMKEKVELFLQRDDNSRFKADKQATLARKGIKKQVRLLNDDLKTLHKNIC